jgi:hypothetical protein
MTKPKTPDEKGAKKLTVKKETLRDLAPKDSKTVKGGARRAGGTEFMYDQGITKVNRK